MPLEPAEKEILLYGGHDNDKNEHLQMAPNVSYLVNGHWRNREGTIQKRLGLKTSTQTGKPTSTDSPAFLTPLSDGVHTFADGTAYRYDIDSDEWEDTAQAAFFSQNTRIGQSERGQIIAHDALTLKDNLAYPDYTVLTHSTPARTTVTFLDPDGKLIGRHIVSGGYGKLVPTTFGAAVITYQSNNLYTTGLFPGANLKGSTVSIVSDVYDGFFLDFPGDEATVPLDQQDGIPSFCVSTPQDDDSYWEAQHILLGYTDTSGNGVTLGCTAGDGFNTIASTMTRPPGAANYVVRYLSFCNRPGTGRYYVLESRWRGAIPPFAATINLLAIRDYDYGETDYTLANGGLNPEPVVSTTVPYTPSGTINYDSSDDTVFGAIYYNGTQWYSTGSSLSSVPSVSLFTANSALSSSNIYRTGGQRLVANAYATGGRRYIGLQLSIYPKLYLASGNSDTADSFLGYLKPTTTCLTDITVPTAPAVVAAFDNLQSKHSDFTVVNSWPFYGGLSGSDSTTLSISNREVFTFEGVSSLYNDAPYIEKYMSSESRANFYSVKLNTTVSRPGVAFNDGAVIPGGVTAWYDGQYVQEMTPINSPEIQTVDCLAGGFGGYMAYEPKTSMLTSSIYDSEVEDWRRVQAVCGYTDAKGNTHRSAPSTVVYTLLLTPQKTDSATNQYEQGYRCFARIAVPLTMAPNANRSFVELYVSDTAEGPPKLAGRAYYSGGGKIINIDFENNAATDAPTSFNNDNTGPITRYTPPVYTTGGVLASDPWPTISYGVVTSQRLWALSDEDTGQVYYSKQFRELQSPEFSAPLVLSLGDERSLTAIGKLDDKVVVFEENAIHVIYGPGPDDTGNAGRSGGFDVHHIAGKVGCNEPTSLAEVPQGLIFKSKRGFYLLDRSLKLTFIGAPVYDLSYNAGVKSVTVVPEWAEVRFLMENPAGGAYIREKGPTPDFEKPAGTRFNRVLPSNACLVYNYDFNRWTLFDGYDMQVSALTAGGRYVAIDDNWDIRYESRPEDDYYDCLMRIETAWIPTTGTLQGYARVKRATLLGKYLTTFKTDASGATPMSDLVVETYYDYEEPDLVGPEGVGYGQGFVKWRANEELRDAPFAMPPRFQVRWKPARKCQSIKFIIRDLNSTQLYLDGPYGADPSSIAYGRGFELSALHLELGIKPGPVRSLSGKRKA